MKKGFSIISIILAMTLIITTLGSTVVFAEETIPTTITFSDDFDTVTTVGLNTLHYYELEVNKPEVIIEAKSSDESILRVMIEKEDENSGYYDFVLAACKNGEATITFTAADGTSVSQTILVEGTGTERNYTISADTTGDFTLPKGNGRIIKINYVSDDWDTFTYPLLVTDDQETSLTTKLVGVDYDNNDFYYSVEAVGNEGQTGILYMSGSGYIPEEFCTVTIKENKNLRLDTRSTYVCNVFDSYRFVAYTTSTTAPEVSTYNDVVEVEYVGRVSGGYEYRMSAIEEGESMVQATLNGETSAFSVLVNNYEAPTVKSDTPQKITLAQGASYTYKLSIMGGGEPKFVASSDGVLSVQTVKKDGIDYYCKVTAIGEPTTEASVIVTFPDTSDDDVKIGDITVTEPSVMMKSDTNSDFSIKQGASYTFKISGATSFTTGTSGVFKTELVKKSDGYSYYKITAIGKPGEQTGLYMSVPGLAAEKICVVTISPAQSTAPVVLQSDTNYNFSVKQGASYTFKITGATSFYSGTSGVFKTELISKSGNESFYKITAIGATGQTAGFYMAAAGQSPQKVCVVTVGAAVSTPVTIQSDTNSDFAIAQKASYQFKITAPGATAVNFNAGTAGVFEITLVRHTGDDFYYKITAIGQSGKEAGIYASVPSQAAKKICKVSIA